jgi:hypothetical protein
MIENETASPAVLVEFPGIADPEEAQLANEVGELWHVHNKAKTSLHQTRDELKRIRINLSHRLHQLKAVLSKPGRGGAWSSFLVSQTIPRSTADRLVRAHERKISAEPDSCTGEHISEPTEVVVNRYVRALWPKLSKVLTSPEAVRVFVAELNRMAERWFADGSFLDPSQAKTPKVPSYLRHLNLPVSAVLDNVAHA